MRAKSASKSNRVYPKEIIRQINSETLRHTEVVSNFEVGITYDRNLVYCASFQIAWNQLTDEIIKVPIELDGNLSVVHALNKRLFDKQDISQISYIALAGFGSDGIVEKIKQELMEKFQQESSFDFNPISPEAIVAYAYLQKSLPFDTIFEVFDKPLLFNDSLKIQSFGIEKSDAASDQVVVLDYRNHDDFIIMLQGSPSIDEAQQFGMVINYPRITDDIILSKLTPQHTLKETIDNILFRISDEHRHERMEALKKENLGYLMSPRLNLDYRNPEILQIPKIAFNIQHNFSELHGKHFLNRGFEHHFIQQAIQATKFKLDETGADLSSEAILIAALGPSPDLNSRQFIFDKPFLLLLREKQATYPYLAVWIGNSELLVKA